LAAGRAWRVRRRVTEAGATSTPTGTGPASTGTAASGRGPAGAAPGPMWPTFVALAALVLALDQLTKVWLTSFLAPGQSLAVLGDLIRLVHGQNAGGLFGLLQGQAVPLALVSLVVVGLILAHTARSGHNPYLAITLGLLLGGALGNLLDRVRLGYVVDFVDAGIGSVRWDPFNLADAAIRRAIVLL